MKKTLWIALLVSALGVSSAVADLVLSINTNDKTIAITGSDTGTPGDFPVPGVWSIQWVTSFASSGENFANTCRVARKVSEGVR
jgi:hypothetical protein